MATTSNMGLVLPDPGVTGGPLYAQQNNNAFARIDAHDHSPNNGVAITPAGMSITADLPFNGNNVTALRSSRYNDLGTTLSAAADVRALYANGGELYYRDASGNNVQLTLGGAVNFSTAGAITGMGATTASVSYNSGTKAFTFASASGVPGGINAGPLYLSPNAANTYNVALTASASMAASYTMTLPASLPASNSVLMVDNAGAVTAPTNVTLPGNLTLGASASLIVGSSTATYASTSPSIARLLVNTALQVVSATTGILKQFASSTRTLEIADSSTGTARPIVVSAAPATHGLMIVRGYVSSTGTINSGEGFSVVKNSTGNYTVTYSSAFTDVPSVTFGWASAPVQPQLNTTSASSFNVVFVNASITPIDPNGWCFSAIGQRNA